MSTKFEIAFPSLDDIPDMAALHVRCWQQAYRGMFPDQVLDSLSIEKRIQGWHRTLSDQAVFSPGVRCDGKWAGFMQCGPTRHKHGDCEVYAIYIDQAQHRTGIGRHLMRMAVDHLSGRKLHEMMVCTLEQNYRARCFYEALGGMLMPDRLVFRLDDRDYPEVIYKFLL